MLVRYFRGKMGKSLKYNNNFYYFKKGTNRELGNLSSHWLEPISFSLFTCHLLNLWPAIFAVANAASPCTHQNRRMRSCRWPHPWSFIAGRWTTWRVGRAWSRIAMTVLAIFRPSPASFPAISTIFKLSVLRAFQPYSSFSVNRNFFDNVPL